MRSRQRRRFRYIVPGSTRRATQHDAATRGTAPVRSLGGGEGGGSATNAVQMHRGREADTAEVGGFPIVVNLRIWKSNFTREVASAAGRLDMAATGWSYPSLPKTSGELEVLGLAMAPPDFTPLDTKFVPDG